MYLTNFHFYPYKNYLYSKPVKGLRGCEASYGFAFNGQEKDDEIAGAGNTMTAEYWEYDSRLGRRWNMDPKPDISISSYACFRNNPIGYFDAKGDTIGINLFAKKEDNQEGVKTLFSKLDGKNDGVFIIACHGSSSGMQIGNAKDGTENKQIFEGDELLKEFRAASPELDAALKEGKKITLMLYSCNTGNERASDVPIAQKIANTSENITVIAPNAFCRTGKLGYYLTSHDDENVKLQMNTFKKVNSNDKYQPNFIKPIKPPVIPRTKLPVTPRIKR
jgi:hypothetical protein